MIYVEVAVTIRRPRSDVAAVMFNPRYDAAWIGAVVAAEPASSEPLRTGATVARITRFLGRRITQRREVVAHAPNRYVELTAAAPLNLRIRYELEGIPEGTIARVRAAGTPRGSLRFLARALTPLLRRAVVRDLGRLKTLLESGASRLTSP
jgi:hypothetical protein